MENISPKNRIMIKLSSFKNLTTLFVMGVFTYMTISTGVFVWGIFLGASAGISAFVNVLQKYVETKKI